MNHDLNLSFRPNQTSNLTPRNQLGQINRYRLFKWVEATSERCATMSHADVAKIATDELKFPVTLANIEAARKSTGVRWDTSATRSAGQRARQDNRRDMLRAAQSDIQTVARELVRWFELVRHPIDGNLLAISRRNQASNGSE